MEFPSKDSKASNEICFSCLMTNTSAVFSSSSSFISAETRSRELEIRNFYKSYNPLDGALTALVLGAFFAFVCLVVIYKTKCRSFWKNRNKKLNNTPNTSYSDSENHSWPSKAPFLSTAAHARSSREIKFESIPLDSHKLSESQLVEEEMTTYYYDEEFGNYIFPIVSPTPCSCSSHNNSLRRHSQISSISNAYTVKSLPGAILCIPILSVKHPGQPKVKRSVSDPEIHFPSSRNHSLIFTLKSSKDLTGKRSSFDGLTFWSSFQGPLRSSKKRILQTYNFPKVDIRVSSPSPSPSLPSLTESENEKTKELISRQSKNLLRVPNIAQFGCGSEFSLASQKNESSFAFAFIKDNFQRSKTSQRTQSLVSDSHIYEYSEDPESSNNTERKENDSDFSCETEFVESHRLQVPVFIEPLPPELRDSKILEEEVIVLMRDIGTQVPEKSSNRLSRIKSNSLSDIFSAEILF